MAEICAPGTATQIVAVFVDGMLLLAARGTKPTPCHRVRFEQSPIDVEPPHFLLRSCTDEDVICIQVIAPYEIVNIFHIGSLRPHVIVHDAAGQHQVPVWVVSDRATFAKEGASILVEASAAGQDSRSAATGAGQERAAGAFGGSDTVPWPFEGRALRTSALFAKRLETVPVPPRHATGYSDTLSFDEAFRNALASLPPDPHPFPDKLTVVRVTGIGAQVGGFVGFHRMSVSVVAF